jgi:hypothetical protein
MKGRVDACIALPVAVAVTLAVAACRSATSDFYLPLAEEAECPNTGGAGGGDGTGGVGHTAAAGANGGHTGEGEGGCSVR